MSYEKEFMQEFETCVKNQVMINEMAMDASKKIIEEDKDDRAADAYIRYESKLDAYRYLLGKFDNYHEGKGFHDMPDNLFGQRHY